MVPVPVPFRFLRHSAMGSSVEREGQPWDTKHTLQPLFLQKPSCPYKCRLSVDALCVSSILSKREREHKVLGRSRMRLWLRRKWNFEDALDLVGSLGATARTTCLALLRGYQQSVHIPMHWRFALESAIAWKCNSSSKAVVVLSNAYFCSLLQPPWQGQEDNEARVDAKCGSKTPFRNTQSEKVPLSDSHRFAHTNLPSPRTILSTDSCTDFKKTPSKKRGRHMNDWRGNL